MRTKNSKPENGTDCEQHGLSNDRAAQMLDNILADERHALSVMDEALLRGVSDSLRDEALTTHMLDEQLDSVLQNNEQLSRDSQTIIAGIRELIEERQIVMTDGGAIPTETRAQDRCRECGTGLGAGYLCDDCDALEVDN